MSERASDLVLLTAAALQGLLAQPRPAGEETAALAVHQAVLTLEALKREMKQ